MLISLISKPGHLTEDHVAQIGGPVRWLSEGEAAEVEGMLPEGLRDDLNAQGVDVNVIPEGPRRKRLLIADMDSTMIQQECIDEMAAHAGIGEKVAEITALAMDGKLGFEEAMTERVGLIKGLPLAALETVFAERIAYMPGGATLLATMKANASYAALVSGGFTFFTEKVASALGFDEHRANVLIHDGQALAGDVGRPILGREAKVEALDDITARLGLSDADVLAVGDGANDLGMLTRAGLGVALHAKPSVQAQASVRVNHGDLTALLYLQGYSKSEFVSA
ncbi:MAG: phosphoserine phosphatase SerB [Pseudomonadota bacterium]